MLLLAIYPTFNLRHDYNRMEQYDRFEIPNLVLDSIKKDNDLSQITIICSDILVYQNIVNEKMKNLNQMKMKLEVNHILKRMKTFHLLALKI